MPFDWERKKSQGKIVSNPGDGLARLWFNLVLAQQYFTLEKLCCHCWALLGVCVLFGSESLRFKSLLTFKAHALGMHWDIFNLQSAGEWLLRAEYRMRWDYRGSQILILQTAKVGYRFECSAPTPIKLFPFYACSE